jgi:hypothetical protein
LGTGRVVVVTTVGVADVRAGCDCCDREQAPVIAPSPKPPMPASSRLRSITPGSMS